jgi:hypothetical protein
MLSNFKVGDRVTWRHAAPLFDGVGRRLNPVGLANCLVLELVDGPGGVPAAQIKIGDQVVKALLTDLHH